MLYQDLMLSFGNSTKVRVRGVDAGELCINPFHCSESFLSLSQNLTFFRDIFFRVIVLVKGITMSQSVRSQPALSSLVISSSSSTSVYFNSELNKATQMLAVRSALSKQRIHFKSQDLFMSSSFVSASEYTRIR
jgi:hypothetical protein